MKKFTSCCSFLLIHLIQELWFNVTVYTESNSKDDMVYHAQYSACVKPLCYSMLLQVLIPLWRLKKGIKKEIWMLPLQSQVVLRYIYSGTRTWVIFLSNCISHSTSEYMSCLLFLLFKKHKPDPVTLVQQTVYTEQNKIGQQKDT